MTLGDRLKALRVELGLSQESFGAQGFVSAPGWIKIENGQRAASEKLIERLCRWLVDDKHMKAGAAATLKEELLCLKYLASRSPFLRSLALVQTQKLPNWQELTATGDRAKPKRGRPVGSIYRKPEAALAGGL